MYRRLFIALFIGIAAAGISYSYQHHFDMVGGDLNFPSCTAQTIVAGGDPYTICPPIAGTDRTVAEKLAHWPTNPVTSALPFLPFTWLPVDIVAALFLGLSSALLAFGLTRDGQYWRLAVFLSFPYWRALQSIQWSILFLAICSYPALMPFVVCKPHIGLPIFVRFFTWRRALLCAVLGLLSLVLMPGWIGEWWTQAHATYNGFVPVLVFPVGPLLLVALIAWRQKNAHTLLLMACLPQNAIYDQLLLWTIPQSFRQMLFMAICSWFGLFAMVLVPALRGAPVVAVVTIYLPMLGVVLWQGWPRHVAVQRDEIALIR